MSVLLNDGNCQYTYDAVQDLGLSLNGDGNGVLAIDYGMLQTLIADLDGDYDILKASGQIWESNLNPDPRSVLEIVLWGTSSGSTPIGARKNLPFIS